MARGTFDANKPGLTRPTWRFDNPDVPRWLKLLVSILLLPLCAGSAMALARVMKAAGAVDTVWIALVSGAACWLAIFLLLPKPMWVYVFGHELTHALWTWALGGKVKKFKASAKGGHVVVSKSNFLTILAPYFFPLYAILLMMLFRVTSAFYHVEPLRVWYHLLLGAAYGFHLTLTWHVLTMEQSDIASQGYLFSGVVIFLGNVVVLLVTVPLLTGGVSVANSAAWTWEATGWLLRRLATLVGS